MSLLSFLAQVFINVFGIIQPTVEQRKRISVVLGGLILAMILAAVTVVGVFLFERHASL